MRYLVLDVGGSSIKHALADERYHLTAPGRVPAARFTTHAEFIDVIGALYDAAAPVDGIAISTAGELDPATGYMFTGGAHLFNAGTNIVADVQARCGGVPVAAENDANCALLAEVYDGVLVGCRNAVALVLGTGVGGAVMINGRIYHGSHFFSGNASLSRVDLRHPTEGPFAMFNGVGALLADYANRVDAPRAEVDGPLFFARLADGDSDAEAALEAYCERLGAFIFNWHVLLDVEAFAVGGGISAQPQVVETLRRHVTAIFDSALFQVPRPEVHACRHGNDANLLGALHHFLTSRN